MQLKKCLLIFITVSVSSVAVAQSKADSVFADFDLSMLTPVSPVSRERIKNLTSYIIRKSSKKGNSIELIKIYDDSSIGVRKASLKQQDFGNVLAFKTLKTPGYEKVLLFTDWDHYHDSLLIRHDTLYFKQRADNSLQLSMLFRAKNDTVIVVSGYRNTRYDFLKKISFEAPLKAYRLWFPNAMFDYTETFTFVKKDTLYDLIKVESDESNSRNDKYEMMRTKYAAVGLSPFWLVLAGLDYEEKKK